VEGLCCIGERWDIFWVKVLGRIGKYLANFLRVKVLGDFKASKNPKKGIGKTPPKGGEKFGGEKFWGGKFFWGRV